MNLAVDLHPRGVEHLVHIHDAAEVAPARGVVHRVRAHHSSLECIHQVPVEVRGSVDDQFGEPFHPHSAVDLFSYLQRRLRHTRSVTRDSHAVAEVTASRADQVLQLFLIDF